jgi:ribosomal protein S18 acetylase RimI-like enzyme
LYPKFTATKYRQKPFKSRAKPAGKTNRTYAEFYSISGYNAFISALLSLNLWLVIPAEAGIQNRLPLGFRIKCGMTTYLIVIDRLLVWKSLMHSLRNEVKTMPDALLVRTGQEKDIDTLVKFNIKLAHQTEQKQLSQPTVTQGVQTLFKNPKYGFYTVAEVDGEVVGCCMVTYEWSDWRCGLFWWIQSVYVKPEFRRQGIFRKLYEFLKEKASYEQNVCGFRLYVEQSNQTGQNTYSGVGMKEAPYKFYEESFQD